MGHQWASGAPPWTSGWCWIGLPSAAWPCSSTSALPPVCFISVEGLLGYPSCTSIWIVCTLLIPSQCHKQYWQEDTGSNHCHPLWCHPLPGPGWLAPGTYPWPECHKPCSSAPRGMRPPCRAVRGCCCSAADTALEPRSRWVLELQGYWPPPFSSGWDQTDTEKSGSLGRWRLPQLHPPRHAGKWSWATREAQFNTLGSDNPVPKA